MRPEQFYGSGIRSTASEPEAKIASAVLDELREE
jgi:hypothetical protein